MKLWSCCLNNADPSEKKYIFNLIKILALRFGQKKKQFKSCVCVWIESMYHKIQEQDAGIYLLQCICSLAPVTSCGSVVRGSPSMKAWDALKITCWKPADPLGVWKCPEVTLKACQSSFIKLNHVLMPPGWSWRTALWRWWWLIFHRKCAC